MTVLASAAGTMSLEQRVGQVFMLGFAGTRVDDRTRRLLATVAPGGLTVFERNVVDGPQLRDLCADLQSLAGPVPLFISIDQEGGLVVRVKSGATVWPSSMALGATGDADLVQRVAVATGRELRAMGVTMQLGPVADVATNPANPVIGTRAFGGSAEHVADMVARTVFGLQSSGVSAVAKHFPGHGDTALDSHIDVPIVRHTRARLQKLELVPFARAIAAGVDAIMTAHVICPALDAGDAVPATLSRAILSGLLREQMGFSGLIMTDALDMGAIRQCGLSVAEAAVRAFEAGADVLCVAAIAPDDLDRIEEAPAALLEAVRVGRISAERLDASVRRILDVKARRATPPVGDDDVQILGSAEHRALALEAARRAITLVRDRDGLLPLRPDVRLTALDLDRDADDLLGAVRAMRTETELGAVAVLAVRQGAGKVETVRQAVDELTRRNVGVVGVALRGPWDVAALTEIGTVVAAYGDRPVHLRAVAEALYGAFTPTGRDPTRSAALSGADHQTTRFGGR